MPNGGCNAWSKPIINMNMKLTRSLTTVLMALSLCFAEHPRMACAQSATTPPAATKTPLPRAATVPLFLNGKHVGTSTVPAGTIVEVVSVTDQELVVRHMGQVIRMSKATPTPTPAQTPPPIPTQAPAPTPAPAATPVPAGYVAAIKYDPADYHPNKTGQPAPVLPKKMIALHRGLRDDAKSQHKTTLAVPAGSEVEILEDRPPNRPVIKYNGGIYKINREDLAQNKTLKDVQALTENWVLSAQPGTEVELLDDTSSTNVVVRYNGGIYKIPREGLAPYEYTANRTQEMVKADPGKSAPSAEYGQLEWIEDSEVIPGLKEKQPEGLWEKALRMDYSAPLTCRITLSLSEKPRSGISVWEMIASYNEENIPPWIAGRYRRGTQTGREFKEKAWCEQNKTTVGIVDYISLRPEFDKWEVLIKRGNRDNPKIARDPKLASVILSVQDALEYLWSKRVGFAVKAEARLIRQAFDDGNAKMGIKVEGTDALGAPISEGTDTKPLEYLRADGGYSVLSPESKAKIPATNLPKLVARELSLHYLDFKREIHLDANPDKSPAQSEVEDKIREAQKNGALRSVPMTALMVEELKNGRVILAAGTQSCPMKTPSSEKIQSTVESKKPGYPFPRSSVWWPFRHMQIITGYYVQYDLSTFGRTGGLFWEFRGNRGEGYADNGYAYIPDHDVKQIFKTELLSLGLE